MQPGTSNATESLSDQKPFRVGPWTVRPGLLRLSREGDVEPTQVGPRLMQLLVRLARTPSEVASREELLTSVWGDAIISEEGLTVAVSELRRLLGDTPHRSRYIETIRGVGYRLIAPVVPVGSSPALDETGPPGSDSPPANSEDPRRRSGRHRRWALPALVAAVAAALLSWTLVSRRSLPDLQTLPLTSFPGAEMHPAIAPGDYRVAFAWAGPDGDNLDIWTTAPEADTPTRLTYDPGEEDHPAWTPDGTVIAFARTDRPPGGGAERHSIYTVPAAGGASRRLVSTPSRVTGLSFSADRNYLAYSLAAGEGTGPRLWLMSLVTGVEQPAPIFGDSEIALSPAFSPAGDRLAFVGGTSLLHNVFVIDLAGGSLVRLTLSQRRIAGLDWTADGERIVFSSAPTGRHELWEVSLGDGSLRQLPLAAGMAVHPTVAREGGLMVFQETPVDTDLWRVRIPSRSDTNLDASALIASTRIDSEADISPRGNRIAFVSARTGHREVWTCDADGGGPTRVTNLAGPYVARPRWSPDGRLLAFTTVGSDGTPHAWVVESGGGEPRAASLPGLPQVTGGWSRDGRGLYLYTARGGGWQIRRMSFETGSCPPVLDDVARFVIEWPNGQLIYERDDGSGLWTYDPDTREERLLLRRDQTLPWADLAACETGVFLLAGLGRQAVISFLDFATGEVRELGRLPFAEDLADSNLAVSPDGTWLLFDRSRDRGESDLVMVRGFR